MNLGALPPGARTGRKKVEFQAAVGLLRALRTIALEEKIVIHDVFHNIWHLLIQ